MTQGAFPQPAVQVRALITPFRVGLSFLAPEEIDRIDQELRGDVQLQGRKFGNDEAVYLPFSPPPGAWRYECQTCRYWQPAGTGGRSFPTCAVVGLDDDPFGGEAIHPLHWCAWWLPARGDPPLRWLAEWLNPALEPARGEL